MEYLDINTCFGSLPWRRFDVGSTGLVAMLKQSGTGHAVTVSLAGALLGPDEGNMQTMRASREHAELLPAFTVNPKTYFGKGNRVGGAAREGFVMVRLFNRLQNWRMNFAPMEVIFEEAHEAGLPVMLDYIQSGDVTDAVRLGAVTGTTVIMTGVGYDGLSEAIVCMTEYPNLYLDTSRLATPDGLRILCEEVGVERVLFGTGAALNYPGSARMTLERSGLAEEDVRAVASGNALRLLGRS